MGSILIELDNDSDLVFDDSSYICNGGMTKAFLLVFRSSSHDAFTKKNCNLIITYIRVYIVYTKLV